MSTVTAVCEDCGVRFFLSNEEAELLPTMRPISKASKKPYLTTWAEWVFHISTHCVECRFSQPPTSCLKDLKKHTQIAKQEKEELQKQELETD